MNFEKFLLAYLWPMFEAMAAVFCLVTFLFVFWAFSILF